MDSCAFEKLFSMSVPHILEKIFFYLDYESYKECLEVSYAWNELLISKSYQKKGKSVFQDELMRDEGKLWIIFLEKDIPHGGDPLTRKIPISTGNLSEVRKILSSGMLDVNSTVGQLGKMMEDPNQSQPNRGPRADGTTCTLLESHAIKKWQDNVCTPHQCHTSQVYYILIPKILVCL